MLEITIPGGAEALHLEHLVLDFNGTLACDGVLLGGVAELLQGLSSQLALHVVTGDTFGRAREALGGLPCRLVILDATGQSEAKRQYVERLGADTVACIGNGRNDRLMMEIAALGIAVMQAEGASPQTLSAADVVTGDVRDALDLLLHPLRLAATLRA
jgi:soluble P-type ATPase